METKSVCKLVEKKSSISAYIIIFVLLVCTSDAFMQFEYFSLCLMKCEIID